MHSTPPFSKNNIKRSIAIGTSVFAIFAFGLLVGNALGTTSANATDGKIDSPLLREVKSLLDEKFVFWKASSTLPDDKQLEYGMVKGYVDSYKDPYTVFLPPKEAKSFAENVQGSFGGVGMNVGMKDGNVVVIAPLKDSPAMKAGIKSGDIITAVDGVSMIGKQSDEAVNMIRGKIDTDVKITVIHPEAKTTSDIIITRKEIKIPTIDTEKKDGVFVIRLYNFSAESPDYFHNALNDFIASGLKYLVVDLRGNPGGYLDSSVNIASYFLKEGQPIVREKQGKSEIEFDHRSYAKMALPDGTKVVVLIDGGSASASEIVAGALQDHKVAKIVGEKSFGKGSVQELVSLQDGSSLKVTIAKWYTPNGTSISEHGIKPDVVSPTATTTPKNGKDGKPIDSQLLKAIEVVKTMK
jgi:carboxyl-terminal processing protease